MDVNDEVRQAVARDVSQAIAKKVAIGVAVLVGFILFIAVGGVVVLLLWNWLLPDIFGVRQITFWQALGLLALCRILFGGFGHHGGSSGGARRQREWWRKRKSHAPVPGATENGGQP